MSFAVVIDTCLSIKCVKAESSCEAELDQERHLDKEVHTCCNLFLPL